MNLSSNFECIVWICQTVLCVYQNMYVPVSYELASKLGVSKLMKEHMDQLIELRNTKLEQEAVDISHLPDDILRYQSRSALSSFSFSIKL